MNRFLPFLPPVLLCLVAFLQVYLVRAHDLSPWKGGGFGMFSTNDDETRHIEVWVSDGQGERRLEITNDQKASGLATFPSEKRLTALAARVAEAERSRGAELHRVRVAAWRRDFVAPAMEPRQVLIREVVIDLGEPPSPR